MKFSALFALAIFVVVSTAHAVPGRVTSKQILCNSPALGYQATVAGKIALQPVPSGAFKAAGKLSVTFGPVTARPNPTQKIAFQGQYDNVQGIEYATLGAVYGPNQTPTVDMLYINFGDTQDKAQSYLEMRGGARQLLNCSASR